MFLIILECVVVVLLVAIISALAVHYFQTKVFINWQLDVTYTIKLSFLSTESDKSELNFARC